MLKRAAVFVALAMFISMVSLTDAHAEARGPKIFGLQVGMPWEEAVQIVKQYANKIGIRVYEEDHSVLIGKGNDRFVAKYIIISRVFQNRKKVNFLADMTIYPKAFNIENMDIEKLK
ncbi:MULTISPECIES: hypothetical protein [unclassified Desulfovibrio]|uniref:hypothetical protein n=1 Tax=unclassified Desulfovibrio TaxID=2593640 RepID=UPI0013EAAB25|nr:MULTISPECIES: hypothetical protein [unclassified Desulfovibrio]